MSQRREPVDLKTPGVYVEEIPSGLQPIAALPTDVAGFVGLTRKGPIGPCVVESRDAFRRTYGAAIRRSHLAHAVRGFFENGGRRCYVSRVLPSEGGARVPDYLGDPAAPPRERTGLAALAGIGEISLLAVPDEVRRRPHDLSGVTAAVVAHCEKRRAVALVALPRGLRDPSALPPRPDSSFGAIYYPWIEIAGAGKGTTHRVPATGHVAGVIARTDAKHGVHKAPANAPVRGALGLEFPVTPAMIEVLNPQGVNCLRDFRESGRGIRVWGARTLSSDPEWKYLNVRRLFLFLERSMEAGTEWAVFEPNDQPLWDRVRSQIGSFLLDRWRQGALQGSKPQEAFFVRCDRSTMTQADIDNGRLVCVIGVAPLRPAEFVIIRIQQLTADASP